MISPLSTFCQRFHRVCRITWRDFLVARDDELQTELDWGTGRKNSLASARTEPAKKVVLDDRDCFRLALVDFEHANLEDYEANLPGRVYSLHQMQRKGRGHSSTPSHLHCLISNLNLYWADVRDMPGYRFSGRWLTPRECLLAQGFPVSDLGAKAHCSFNKHRRRNRTAVLGQAGNAMFVPCPVLCALFMTTQVPRTVGRLANIGRMVALLEFKRKRNQRDENDSDDDCQMC